VIRYQYDDQDGFLLRHELDHAPVRASRQGLGDLRRFAATPFGIKGL